MIASPDGHCKPFERQTRRATVPWQRQSGLFTQRCGQAMPMATLIHAVIQGSALITMGRTKFGFYRAKRSSQASVIEKGP